MSTIFMNFENSKTSDPQRVLLNFIEETELRREDKYISWSNFSIFYTWENIERSCKNNKSKISAPKWDKKFELPELLSTKTNINNIENRITFKIKTGYLELLTPEIMKLLASTKSTVAKERNGEHFSRLEITELVSIHYNIVNSGYQQDSVISKTFFPKKWLVNY